MSKRRRIALILLAVVLWVTPLFAADTTLPEEVKNAGISEKLGGQVPLDVVLTDSSGVTVSTKTLFDGDHPVVLVMAYYNCPMLCNLVLSGVASAVSNNSLVAGDRYRLITISIDPADTPDTATAYKKRYTEMAGRQLQADGWDFLIGDEASVRKIGNAVGFGYQYVEETKEYAHGAAIMILTPEGKISRYLYGIEFKPRDFKLALLEASDRKFVSTTEKVVMYCFAYDPHSRGYALVAVNIMKLGGLITVIVLGGFIIWPNLKHKDRGNNHG